MQYTNESNIPLPLAVWLAHSDYDFVGGYNKISVTSLMNSTRKFILSNRVPLKERNYDVSDFIASRFGSALHDSIERSWTVGYREALKSLGYPEKVIDRIKINPVTTEEDDIPVYLEQRGERKFNEFTISGKFDMVIEGELFDTKSTSVYAHIMGNKDEDYILQGSMYKWIFPELISGDHLHIQHIFTDWSRAQANQNKDYPQNRLLNRTLELLSLSETEEYINHKTSLIKKYINSSDEEIPFCTDKELWRSPPKYKYYSNPDKTDGRSTKNFDNLSDANKYKAEKGKGVVLVEPGQVKACEYCPAFTICKQKDLYFNE